MKSPMLLWITLAEESASWCCTSATRDIKYAARRYEHEGLSFLTISLPAFGKDFQKSLDLGHVDRNLFTGFPWQAGLPRFLGGFLDLVFDRASGELKDSPSIDAISCIRQLSLMFQKILIPCTVAREKEAMDKWLLCEQEVRESDSEITPLMWHDFERIGLLLFGSCFSRVEKNLYDGELVPKHGPGATADRLRGNAKFRHQTWPARLESLFPFGDYALPNLKYAEKYTGIDFLEPGAEIPVRVVSVPKTQKTPRIIAIEPTAMQYSQQAIKRSILDSIDKDKTLSVMLGFDDQTPNQRMARSGSLNGSLATLDLSEASDRVSNQHVRHLVKSFPYLRKGLDATRSRKADVNGRVVRLAKYASMGSALCFPLEAMVFLTIVFMGIEQKLNSPLTTKIVKSLRGSVRIFGDDIIVPSDCARPVVEALESFGIRVNRDKSFWNGKFRESCGKEYYDGHDVGIVKFRREFPSSRENAAEVESLVSFRNQLYERGYWRTCDTLDTTIRKVIKYYPVVAPTSSVVGRHSFLGYSSEKTSKDTFSPLVKGWRMHSRSPKDPLDGPEALLKCLLRLEERYGDKPVPVYGYERLPDRPFWAEASSLPTVSDQHLERFGRPQSVTLKLGWYSPF